jgi:UDP-N-acetylglucosamine 2-epimerase (non-hydrolysing)
MPIVGVRPQIVKSAPVLRALTQKTEIELQLVNSGQHYDYEMSKVFFNELDLPKPICDWNVGSGSHAVQTARLLICAEKIITKLKPDVVMVFGDANTSLGAALAAVKIHTPVCHVESGLRSYDILMPEEVNRVLIDHCSQMLCSPTITAVKNLKKEGICEERILLSGDTMYDSFLLHRRDVEKSTIIRDLKLVRKKYGVLTVHRAENADNPEKLKDIILAMGNLKETMVVFPVHPRVRKRLEDEDLAVILRYAENILLTDPLGYFDMLSLMENAKVVLTDSGGMQKEAFMLHVPCLTLRDTTEWTETIEFGANKLVGTSRERILEETRTILSDEGYEEKLERLPNPYGDGKASERIVENLLARNWS